MRKRKAEMCEGNVAVTTGRIEEAQGACSQEKQGTRAPEGWIYKQALNWFPQGLLFIHTQQLK